MKCASWCRDLGTGEQQHGVQSAGSKTRVSSASSEPFIHIERRRSKEENKCQTCRCANKLKLEQEKKKTCYILSALPHLSTPCDVTFLLRGLHTLSLTQNQAVNICTGWHDSAAAPNQCHLSHGTRVPRLLKDGERKRAGYSLEHKQ